MAFYLDPICGTGFQAEEGVILAISEKANV